MLAREKTKTKIIEQASSSASAMQEMMETIDALRGVYARETEALAKADTQGFFALQDEKMETARRYQGSVERILAHKDEIAAADPQLKNRLAASYKEFSAASEKNMNALARMSRCIDRIGDTMRHAAKEEAAKKRAFSYGQSGVLQRAEHKSVSMGVSETA